MGRLEVRSIRAEPWQDTEGDRTHLPLMRAAPVVQKTAKMGPLPRPKIPSPAVGHHRHLA
jgi:hypothetical protein